MGDEEERERSRERETYTYRERTDRGIYIERCIGSLLPTENDSGRHESGLHVHVSSQQQLLGGHLVDHALRDKHKHQHQQ